MDPELLAVLEEIGKGILQAVGAKILESLMGGGQDLVSFYTKLITAISAIVKQELDENDIQIAVQEISEFEGLLQEYLNSPSTRLFTLKDLVDKSASYPISTLSALLNSYPSAAIAYLGGALFRLTVLQEFAKVTKAPGDFKNFTSYAAQAAEILRGVIPPLTNLNEARVSAIREWSEADGMDHGADPQPIYLHYCAYTLDGVEKRFSFRAYNGDGTYPEGEANAARNNDLQAVRTQFQNGVLVPINDGLAQLDKIAAMRSLTGGEPSSLSFERSQHHGART